MLMETQDNLGTADSVDLPFRLGIVRTDEQLSAICQVRCKAYSRHLPSFGQGLAKPESFDTLPGVLNLFIQDKQSNRIIATARLQNNLFHPLAMSAAYPLPSWLLRAPSAEITRFAVLPEFSDAERLISKVLVKACYHYCFATQIGWIVIASRRSLVKWYLAMGYRDIDATASFHRLSHMGNLPHRVLLFDVVAAERNWFTSQNVDYDFMHRVFHPDIELFSSISSIWTRSRQGQRPLTLTDPMLPII